MLGVKSSNSLSFYEWETLKLMRRIEIVPKQVMWAESGELVCIATEDSYYILRYLPNVVAAAKEVDITDDGVEGAFDVKNFY